MDNNSEPFSSRFDCRASEDRLIVRVEPADAACDETFSAMIDAVLKQIQRDRSKVVEFDFAGHLALGSSVMAELLRLRHEHVKIEISNASAHMINQLEVTKIDTVIHVRRN